MDSIGGDGWTGKQKKPLKIKGLGMLVGRVVESTSEPA
jgi:hypothetical protein